MFLFLFFIVSFYHFLKHEDLLLFLPFLFYSPKIQFFFLCFVSSLFVMSLEYNSYKDIQNLSKYSNRRYVIMIGRSRSKMSWYTLRNGFTCLGRNHTIFLAKTHILAPNPNLASILIIYSCRRRRRHHRRHRCCHR